MNDESESQTVTRRADDILPARAHAKLAFRKVVAGSCLGAAALMGVMGSAMAKGTSGPPFGNPHFIKSETSASLSGADLVVSFKEAGLPSGATETVTSSATATTSYECVNGGGKHPQASNKFTSQTQLSESGQFQADQNGNITGQQTLTAPTAVDLNFSCPNGQVVTFVGVSYSNITVTDSTSGATISLPGQVSYTNPDAPPCRNNCF